MSLIKKLYIAGCWVLSSILPVDKKKVVFCSYYGRGYSDNPKAICEALRKKDGKVKIVWLVKDEKEASTLPADVIPCKYDSAKRVWQLATARVWVDNCRKYDRVKKRGQYYLQTWHGFPLKQIEKDAIDSLPSDYEKGALRDSGFIDLLLSNCGFVTETLRRCFWYDGEIAEYGSPRNDVFINGDHDATKRVRKSLGIPENKKFVLYAPTFRVDKGAVDCYAIDAENLRRASEKRFGGDWAVVIRLHPNVAKVSEKLFKYDPEHIINGTMHADMQELLSACDLLITDYSSSMFDYALSGKPCVRFANDLKEYIKDRNFYFKYDEIPFPYAENNEDLITLIESFDTDKYYNDTKAFYSRLAFREDGHASERCADWIENKLK
ncbi:MAG: glycerophosphotransferase [Ruminococcaceae bacterium]|nr:glycerophosphotransferase [Oscillospiraceae bacterium]